MSSDAKRHYHSRRGPEHPSDCGCPYHTELRLESRIAALTAESMDSDGVPWRVCAEAAEKALADARKELATERSAREEERIQANRDMAAQVERDRVALEQAERDTALARVKEWERAYDSNGFGPQNPSEVQVFLRERDRVNGQVAALRVSAAESALASARELIERARAWLAWPTPAEPGPEPAACLLNALESWLSSAPSPAPERSDKRSRWNELGELPVTVMAASKYPSPAPCPGCASARELLVLWYHNRSETESGELIEVETQNWLKEHGE